MKKTLFIFITSIALFSCDKSLKRFDKIEIDNGSGKKVSILYNVSADLFPKIKMEDLNHIIDIASCTTKSECNHSETYIPKSVNLDISHDTINAEVFFSAQNSYGVPDENFVTSQFKYDGIKWTFVCTKKK